MFGDMDTRQLYGRTGRAVVSRGVVQHFIMPKSSYIALLMRRSLLNIFG